jgi:hypothetical protein
MSPEAHTHAALENEWERQAREREDERNQRQRHTFSKGLYIVTFIQ